MFIKFSNDFLLSFFLSYIYLFSAVNQELKNIGQEAKGNVVEYMMKQLEDYSGKLQELVNERTMELLEEKKKTEQLLMKMLPP